MRFITQKQATAIDTIEAAVVAAYRIPMETLKSRNREDHIASVRHILWRALKERVRLTTVFIGERYQRDHTTVMAGIQRARGGYLANEYTLFTRGRGDKVGIIMGKSHSSAGEKSGDTRRRNVHNLAKKR